MPSVVRHLPTLLVAALCCAPTAARGQWNRNSVRLVTHEEPTKQTGPKLTEPAPPPSYYVEPGSVYMPGQAPVKLEPVEPASAEESGSSIVGAELGSPAPNPYEATEPPEPPTYNCDPNLHAPPPHGYEHHHPGLAYYLKSRPRQPTLQRESWLNRPYNASFLLGGLFLDNPIAGQTDGEPGFMYGVRFGWDFGPSFGVETRIAGANPGIKDPQGVMELPPAKVFVWDMNWLWYWTGDTRWRPYFSAGMGMFDIQYDTTTQGYHETTFAMPFGIGLKYRHSTRVAMRFDLIDNFTFASGQQDAMHNLSITAGLEARFGGGSRRNYWPWNPGHDWR